MADAAFDPALRGALGHSPRPPRAERRLRLAALADYCTAILEANGGTPGFPSHVDQALAVEPPKPRPTYGLRPSHLRVLDAMAAGAGTRDAIAAACGIAPSTAANHLRALYAELDVDNMVAALVAAHRLGVVGLPQPDGTFLSAPALDPTITDEPAA